MPSCFPNNNSEGSVIMEAHMSWGMLLRRREEGGDIPCGRMHARLYPRTRQNDSCDDRAATVPASPSLPAHKWLLCASVRPGTGPYRKSRTRLSGTFQREMPTLSGFDRFHTEKGEEPGEETATGSLAKSAGSFHSHPEFNILMCSANRRSNKRERLRGWVGKGREKEGGPFQ